MPLAVTHTPIDDVSSLGSLETELKQAKRAADSLKAAALAVFVVPVLAMIVVTPLGDGFGDLDGIFQGAIAVTAFLLNTFLWVWGMGYDDKAALLHGRVNRARALQSPDPPVLILRSFADPRLWSGMFFIVKGDSKAGRQHEGPAQFEALTNTLAAVGPALTLCREDADELRLHYAGSSHVALRCSDAAWQQTFRTAALSSRAIVIWPGTTPGLREEIEFLRAEGLLDRCFVAMPVKPARENSPYNYVSWNQYDEAWEEVRRDWIPHGLNLPPYEDGIGLYAANPDLSKSEGWPTLTGPLAKQVIAWLPDLESSGCLSMMEIVQRHIRHEELALFRR